MFLWNGDSGFWRFRLPAESTPRHMFSRHLPSRWAVSLVQTQPSASTLISIKPVLVSISEGFPWQKETEAPLCFWTSFFISAYQSLRSLGFFFLPVLVTSAGWHCCAYSAISGRCRQKARLLWGTVLLLNTSVHQLLSNNPVVSSSADQISQIRL